MSKTQTRPRPRRTQGGKPGAGKPPQQPWYAKYPWLPWAGVLAIAIVTFLVLRPGDDPAPAPGVSVTNPVVGADLHSLVVDPDDSDTLFIGSHQGVSVSTNGGKGWEVVESLNGADAMGWAFTSDEILVGGHPGISVSSDGGATFQQRNDGLPSTDVHALGAGDDVIYAGLAGVGTFASSDGIHWEERSTEFGGAFMGRIQVDPKDEEHIIAPDMGSGAVESKDGGHTWEALGGVQGAMWVSWDEGDTDHIVVTTQGSAAESTDGGASWKPLTIPDGASIVEFSPHDGDILFAAVLETPEASVYVSEDGGATWARP